jgi:1,4-dihydroxy-2-naphthoate octaprenyltransferase
MNKLATILGPMRVPFLILTPPCVALGYTTARWATHNAPLKYFILATIGAVAAHISVNAFNEYFDFTTGLDNNTNRTPFSGGSGTLQARPEAAKSALATSWISFLITAVIGVYFVAVCGWGLLPIGLFGLFLIYTYTKYLVYNPVLCLLAPGIGFGPLMVMGTYYICTGTYSYTAFLISLIPFYLVCNLLLLNQFPDVEADAICGRKHFPILIGRRKSSYIYALLYLLNYTTIGAGVFFGLFPPPALLGLVTLPLALPSIVGAVKYSNDIDHLLHSMKLNVFINILTPVFLSIGFLVAHS